MKKIFQWYIVEQWNREVVSLVEEKDEQDGTRRRTNLSSGN